MSSVNVVFMLVFLMGKKEVGIPVREEYRIVSLWVVDCGMVCQPLLSGVLVLRSDAWSGILGFPHRSFGPFLLETGAISEELNRVARPGDHMAEPLVRTDCLVLK